MIEDYTDFENVELLKEKGFQEAHLAWPTLGLTEKWLREKHGIEITVTVGYVGKERKKTYFWDVYVCKDDHIEYPMDEELTADTHEQAENAAIRYALEKLI